MKESIVELLSDALRQVRGLSALVLGGSRARGIASASSDYDLGLEEPSMAFPKSIAAGHDLAVSLGGNSLTLPALPLR